MELQKVRAGFLAQGVDAIWVGSGDAHQSEYVATSEERRAAVSGFTGSAGTVVITAKGKSADSGSAALWTDGRYFLQGEQQLSSEWMLMRAGNKGVPEINDWLVSELQSGSVVGVDGRLLSTNEAERMNTALVANDMRLEALATNPVDCVWTDRPTFPAGQVRPHPLALAGKSHNDKVADIRGTLKAEGCVACVLSMLDEICWLLNLRGCDVDFNPVFYAFCVVTLDGVHLFGCMDSFGDDVKAHLGKTVMLHPYEETRAFCASEAARGRVMADPAQLNWELFLALGASAKRAVSPVTLPKAVKNEVELNGIRQAHLRDGAALTAFLHWLETTVQAGETVTEFTAAEKLETFREQMPTHVSPSFSTISSYGANGAVIHYKPERDTAAVIGTENLYLLDSGAQYADGTTDVTRTVHFGEPTARMKDCYSMVLQGHIGLATAVFPEGTLGSRLDAIARLPLWQAGLDYNHGTGHGVGAHLNVHEGPQGIGFRKRENEEGFQVGMTISNEPGYYEDGNFGIRIETVCIAVAKPTANNFMNKTYCGLETVTMTPIGTALVNASMLSAKEVSWLNAYNAEVCAKLQPIMEKFFPGAAVDYLKRECQPLAL